MNAGVNRRDADIATPRLLLRLMPPGCIRACLEGDYAGATALLGAAVPDEVAGFASGMRFSLRALAADPAYAPWSSRALVLRASRAMVGHLRFHAAPGAPDLLPHAPYGVELGYGVLPGRRRQGLAREAAIGAMSWAERSAGVHRFVVSVAPDNEASLALAAALGFRRVGEHIDDVDGLEYVLLRDGLDQPGRAIAQSAPSGPA